MKITLKRTDNAYQMEATNEDGLTVKTDAGSSIGGQNSSFRPMQMVLTALGSCSSIDIIFLLNKQRQPLEHIEVEIDSKREETAPKVFTDIHVLYKLYGELNEKKAERACRLSMEKMCSVSKMLEKSVNITWSYQLMGDYSS